MIKKLFKIVGMKPQPKVKVVQPIYVKRKFKNDDAQIAVILMFFLCLVFVGFYWVVLSGIMDQTTVVHNNVTANSGLYTSQDRQDSMLMLGGTFGAFPLMALILIIFSAIIAAIAAKYNTV